METNKESGDFFFVFAVMITQDIRHDGKLIDVRVDVIRMFDSERKANDYAIERSLLLTPSAVAEGMSYFVRSFRVN